MSSDFFSSRYSFDSFRPIVTKLGALDLCANREKNKKLCCRRAATQCFLSVWLASTVLYLERSLLLLVRVSTSLGNGGLYWTVFARNRDTAVPAEGNGDLQTLICVLGEIQTMFHIVESCPLTKLSGGLSRLHSTDVVAVSWLTNYGKWHACEKKKK